MDRPIRIMIADDHPILREGLRKLLEAEGDFTVAGEVCNGHEALEIARQLEPDMLLLDLVMPGVPCFEVLRSLTTTALPTRTILLTASIEPDEIDKALQLTKIFKKVGVSDRFELAQFAIQENLMKPPSEMKTKRVLATQWVDCMN